jgi:hypothetical protein
MFLVHGILNISVFFFMAALVQKKYFIVLFIKKLGPNLIIEVCMYLTDFAVLLSLKISTDTPLQ